MGLTNPKLDRCTRTDKMEQGLIEEYKTLAAICASTDFDDKQSVGRNNEAVKRMYAIIESLNVSPEHEGVAEFTKLLDVEENKTNLWVATQLLERTSLDGETETKALNIIKKVAAGDSADALGFRYWLKDWNNKNK